MDYEILVRRLDVVWINKKKEQFVVPALQQGQQIDEHKR